MTRITLLVAVLVASTALLVSTGAAPFSTGTDDVEGVDIVMEPADGPNGKYAVIDENGEIALLLSGENPDLDAEGIAGETVTPLHRVFTITNNGTETARVWIEDDADDVRFYRADDPEDSLEGPENEFDIGPGATVHVGLLVDTRGDHDVENVSQFTVHVEQGTPEEDDGTDDGTDGDSGGDETDGDSGGDGTDDGTDGGVDDTTPPTVSGFDAANPEGQNVSISFDSDKQLSKINVTLRGPENATLAADDFAYDPTNGTYAATYDGSSDGTYTATLHAAADAAGNDGATAQSDQVTVDTTPPTVSILEPTDGADYNGSDVSLAVSADEPISNWSYSVDGATNQSFSPNTTLAGLPEDQYNVTVYAEDDAGNVGSKAVTFTIDTTAPTIPDDSFTVTNPEGQNVSIGFDSDEQLSKINVTLRGPENATLTEDDFAYDSVNGTYAATYVGSRDGTYSVTLTTAKDAAGNDGATGQLDTVTIDTTAPTVDSFSATNPEGQNVSISFNSTEPLSKINVTLRGPENATLAADDFAYDSANGTYTATYDGSSDGNYTATLHAAADVAGNDGALGQTDTVEVDTADTSDGDGGGDVAEIGGSDVTTLLGGLLPLALLLFLLAVYRRYRDEE
ncbi:MAG: Ig-like domain-containing protein [Halapricum sp.]